MRDRKRRLRFAHGKAIALTLVVGLVPFAAATSQVRTASASDATVIAASDPVAIKGGPNAMDLFVTGNDGNLHHRWYNSGVWSWWENLGQPGAAVAGDVSVIVEAAGTATLFARGSDGGLSILKSHPGGWNAWTRIASNDGGDPVAGTGNGFESADVYYRDSVTQNIDSTWWNGTGWSTSSLPGRHLQGKPAVREAGGVIEVTVRETNNEVWTNWFTGVWNSWADRHGATGGNPSTSTSASGEIDIFIPGTDNVTPWMCIDSTGCTAWMVMPGTVANGDIAPTKNAPDVTDNFFRGTDGTLRFCGGANCWNGYTIPGVTIVGTPSVIGSSSPYRFDTFVRGTDNLIYWNVYSAGWSGFNLLGPGSHPCNPGRTPGYNNGHDAAWTHSTGPNFGGIYSQITNESPYLTPNGDSVSGWVMLQTYGNGNQFAQAGWYKATNGTYEAFAEGWGGSLGGPGGTPPDGRTSLHLHLASITAGDLMYYSVQTTQNGVFTFWLNGVFYQQMTTGMGYLQAEVSTEIHDANDEMAAGIGEPEIMHDTQVYVSTDPHGWDPIGAGQYVFPIQTQNDQPSWFGYSQTSTSDFRMWDKACSN